MKLKLVQVIIHSIPKPITLKFKKNKKEAMLLDINYLELLLRKLNQQDAIIFTVHHVTTILHFQYL